MRTPNRILLLSCLFLFALSLCSLNIPFFWDGTFFSEAALFFFHSADLPFIPPVSCDTGGFPLFPLYLSFCWKIFGKSLVVSHLGMLPVLFGIVFQYFRLARRYLPDSMLPLAMALLLTEPVFLTQSMLMGYDLLMIWFFLLAINYLFENNQRGFAIAFLLLNCSSMRGIMLGGALFILELFLKRSCSFRMMMKYLPALLFILSWSIYHHSQTGWYFFSPERAVTDEAWAPPSTWLRQAGYIVWKISDFGRIFLWVFLALALFYFYRKRSGMPRRELILLLVIPSLTLSLFILPFGISIAHKYFLATFLLLNIAVCSVLQQLSRKKTQGIFFGLFLLVLISGNFWKYPERYGNGWDASLKVIPYFELKDSMDRYIITQGILPPEVGTQFPLIADKQYSHLYQGSFKYENVWRGPVRNWHYILLSDVINTDIPGQFDDVRMNWNLLKRFEKGQVSIALYENPAWNIQTAHK